MSKLGIAGSNSETTPEVLSGAEPEQRGKIMVSREILASWAKSLKGKEISQTDLDELDRMVEDGRSRVSGAVTMPGVGPDMSAQLSLPIEKPIDLVPTVGANENNPVVIVESAQATVNQTLVSGTAPTVEMAALEPAPVTVPSMRTAEDFSSESRVIVKNETRNAVSTIIPQAVPSQDQSSLEHMSAPVIEQVTEEESPISRTPSGRPIYDRMPRSIRPSLSPAPKFFKEGEAEAIGVKDLESAPDSERTVDKGVSSDEMDHILKSKQDRIKINLEVLAHNKQSELLEDLEYERRIKRVEATRKALVSPFTAPIKWLAAPFVAAAQKDEKFSLKKWAMKPIETLVIKPAKAIFNGLSQLSSSVRKFDGQDKFIDEETKQIKAENKRQNAIEDLGYEAVVEYAARLNSEGSSLTELVEYLNQEKLAKMETNARKLGNKSPKFAVDMLDGSVLIEHCLNPKNKLDVHYMNVQRLIDQRKTELTDKADAELAKIEDYKNSLAKDIKNEALKNSAFLRARELAKLEKGAMDKFKAFAGEVLPQPKLGKKARIGLALVAAFGLAALSMSQFKKEKPQTQTDQSSLLATAPTAAPGTINSVKTEQNKQAPNVVDSVKSAEPLAANSPVSDIPAPKVIAKKPVEKVRSKTTVAQGKVTAKTVDLPKKIDVPKSLETKKVDDKKDVVEVADAPLTEAELSAALTAATNKVAEYKLAAQAMDTDFSIPAGARSAKSIYGEGHIPSFDILRVNDLADKIIPTLKGAKTHKDLDKLNAIYTEIDGIIQKNAGIRADMIFQSTISADIPVISSTDKMVKESKMILAGMPHKFVIRYDEKYTKGVVDKKEGKVVSTSEIVSYRDIDVDLDAYEKEYLNYATEINEAKNTKKPIAESKLRVYHARMTWLHAQMAFVRGYLSANKDLKAVTFAS